jgi:hypothetical protein
VARAGPQSLAAPNLEFPHDPALPKVGEFGDIYDLPPHTFRPMDQALLAKVWIYSS